MRFLSGKFASSRICQGPFVSAPIKDGNQFIARPIRIVDYLNDSTPDQFAIQPYFDQLTDSMVEMQLPVTITGITVPTYIEIDFSKSDPTAFLSVNGKPFQQSTQTIRNGDTFKLKVRTSNLLNRQVQVRVVAGGVAAIWLVSTGIEGTPDLQTGLSTRLSVFARTQTSITFGWATRSNTQYRMILVPYDALTPTAAQVLAGQAGNSLAPVFDTGLQASTAGLQVRRSVFNLSGKYRAYLVVADEPSILESLSAVTAAEVTNIIGARLLHIRPVQILRRFINLHIRNR